MGYFREDIEKCKGYTPGFQPQDSDVIKLNTNENPYPPSPAVMEAIRSVGPEQLRRYPEPLGEQFRQAAAQINGVQPANIICCNGGDELLRMCFEAFCDTKRAVAYPVPTYSLYPVLARLQGCPVIELAFDREFNLPAKLASTKAALTIVCNPNAPTGSVVTPEQLSCLADEIKGVLLIDEAYVDFAETTCVELVKQFDNVIILRSMSKSYCLAGMRLGYGIAQRPLIEGLIKVKDSYNLGVVAISAAAAALRDREYFRRNIEKIKQQRSLLTDKLTQLGFEPAPSHANFVLVRCRHCNASQLHRQLARKGIYIRYFNQPGLEDKLRITIGTAQQNDKLITALKEILSSQGKNYG